MENHPKIYIALDKKLVCELADKAKAEMDHVDMGNTNEKRIKNETVIEMVQWILDNTYTLNRGKKTKTKYSNKTIRTYANHRTKKRRKRFHWKNMVLHI